MCVIYLHIYVHLSIFMIHYDILCTFFREGEKGCMRCHRAIYTCISLFYICRDLFSIILNQSSENFDLISIFNTLNWAWITRPNKGVYLHTMIVWSRSRQDETTRVHSKLLNFINGCRQELSLQGRQRTFRKRTHK